MSKGDFAQWQGFQGVFFFGRQPQKVAGKHFNGVTVLVWKKFGELVDMVSNKSSILTEEYHES